MTLQCSASIPFRGDRRVLRDALPPPAVRLSRAPIARRLLLVPASSKLTHSCCAKLPTQAWQRRSSTWEYATNMTQTDQIRSGSSYLSQHDFRVHFGLGEANKIDSLEIHWPSGSTDVLRNLAADQFYSILEGKGLVPPTEVRPRSPARR
jgi:ASPIC and UnbV